MKEYRLSFCTINICADNIAEVIIDENIEVSIEMVEEHDEFLCSIFKGSFGVLVNKINTYSYAFEAQLVIGLINPMTAIASVNYSPHGTQSSQDILNKRTHDRLNIKTFIGTELAWHQAYDWLTLELSNRNHTAKVV